MNMARSITEAPATPPAFGPDFRNAMRRLAATVSIITARDATGPIGMTATSVTSLSMEPPSLLVCVNRAAGFHAGLVASPAFCVNILGVEDSALCAVFGGKLPRDQRFQQGQWCDGEGGVPCLASAQASIFCRNDSQMDYGTHTIFVGLVQAVRLNGAPAPLVYQDGGLGRVVALGA